MSGKPTYEELEQRVKTLERSEAESRRLNDNFLAISQKLQLHIEQTPLGVIDWNLNFEVEQWNSGAEKIFGFTQNEAIGKHASFIVPNMSKESVNKIWKSLVNNTGGIRSTNENITKDNKIISCEWYNTPLIGLNGNVVGVFSFVMDITDRKQTENALQKSEEKLNQTQKISVKALAILAEYYDLDTGEHLSRIQSYVEILSKWLKENSHFKNYLSKKESYIDDLKLACLLHDVGKTAIPVEILTKPGKLTDEEFEIIKTHTTIAGDALTKANDDFRKTFKSDSYLALARDIALYHHEKWNGKGYPEGLSGESISLSARIVAVADVYDALRSERPYKKPWSHVKAVNEIVGESGKHFDPEIIRGFISLSDKFHAISKNHNQKNLTKN